MKNIFTLLFLAFTGHFSLQANPNPGQLRTNLYITEKVGAPTLMDGTLSQFADTYSNNLDGMDARKVSNFSENWGMLRNNITLVVERRQTIQVSDTIFFKMWNMRKLNYKIQLIASNMEQPGMIGILHDNYLQTTTQVDLNDTTWVNFTVTNDAASKATDRFLLVFSAQKAHGLLPLTFTAAKVQQSNQSLNVNFQTANEKNVKEFDIERSSDGTRFIRVAGVNALNKETNNYSWTDASPLAGNNFYRIRSIDIDGKTQYSEVMKAFAAKGSVGLNVYPNPVKNNQLNLQMINQQAGIYEVRLVNSFGQNFQNKKIDHKGGSNVISIMPSQNIPKGIYRLEVMCPDGTRQVISVVF